MPRTDVRPPDKRLTRRRVATPARPSPPHRGNSRAKTWLRGLAAPQALASAKGGAHETRRLLLLQAVVLDQHHVSTTSL